MNEQLEQACALLRDRIEEKVPDKECREAVYMLLDAHESAKRVVGMLREQLQRAYDILDRITSRPEFRELMEEAGMEKKEDGSKTDGEA